MLSGHTQGASRKGLLENARSQASTYYGLDCLEIVLSHEESDADFLTEERIAGNTVSMGKALYRAEFTAEIKHGWSKPSYGFAKCHKCNVENFK